MNELIDNILPILRFISGIISLALLAGIFYLVNKVDYFNVILDSWFDTITLGGNGITKRRSLRAWKVILKHLRSHNPEKWGMALEQSDKILDEILKNAGYPGKDLDERLDHITPDQFENIDELRKAHNLAKEAMGGEEVALRKEDVEEAIYIYKKVFVDLRLLRE